MLPVIGHQALKYTKDLRYNSLKYWLVHNTPYGYMESDDWTKATIHLKTVCGEDKLNTKFLFYYGNGSRFEHRAIHIILYRNITPFVLKGGDSVNEQPNDNGPNHNLKGIHGQSRISCQRQHVTLKFKTSYMDAVLVVKWSAFQLYSDPFIINYLILKKLVYHTIYVN